MALIASSGRSTLTNAITLLGNEQKDWSATYRVFNKSEWNIRDIFRSVIEKGVSLLPPDAPVVIAMDDTNLPKTGIRIPQASYCYNPLAPKFLDLKIRWAIRMMHAALLIPDYVNHRPLAISTAFEPVPPAPKPRKTSRRAPAEQQDESPESEKAQAKATAKKQPPPLTQRAQDLIREFRKTLDRMGLRSRQLLLVVDGSFTNGPILDSLPHDTELVGRTKKNTKLFAPSASEDNRKVYGEQLPTPEDYRKDPSIPTLVAELHYGGALRAVKYKEILNVLWKGGSKRRPMRLLIVMPTPYVVVGRKRRGYNLPGYLLTTDLSAPAGQLIQGYLDRWQIEVLHRDLKAGLGVGQVQASSPEANEKVHGTQAATFAMLNIAALETVGGYRGEAFPPLQAWRLRKPPMRISQHDLITLLRNNLLRIGFIRDPRIELPEGWVLTHRETYQNA